MTSVLMLAENPIPATRRVSRPHYVAQALAERAFDVRTITCRSEAGEPLPGCRHVYLPIIFEQFSLAKRLSFLVALPYVLLEILRSAPAVLHGQGFLPGLIVVLCSHLSGIPCVVGMPDFVEALYESFHFPLGAPGLRVLTALENLVARGADALIVEGQLAKAEWSRRGVEENRIHPIHHAVDLVLFAPDVRGDGIRETYALAGKLLITYHGDIGEDDGVDVLLRAFGMIAGRYPSAMLMIIGTGAERTMTVLRELASGLDGRVIFTGWVPYREVPEYIAAADVGVAPFRSTLYTNAVVPTKVLEIMAMRKPAIVSRLATFGQIVSQGRHCLMVEPGSVEELASALARSIEDGELCRVLGENGRRLVEERFSWATKVREEAEVVRAIAGC